MSQRLKEVKDRELARQIMEAALHKIEQLGFVPILRERDALNRHSGRHHVVAKRLEYLYVGEEKE